MDPPKMADLGASRARRRYSGLVAVMIFALALAMRLVFLAQLDAYPRFELIRNRLDDQTVFVNWARAMRDGRPLDVANTGHEFAYWAGQRPAVYPQAPLYPWLLAGVYSVAGWDSHDAIRWFQALLGALAALLTYLVARRFVPMGWAAVAGLVVALYGPLVFYSSVLLRPTLLTFLSVLSLWMFTLPMQRTHQGQRLRWLATGAVLGLAALTRPNFLLFAVVALCVEWRVARRSDRDLGKRILLWAGLGLALPLLAVSARNTLASGGPAFISSNGPFVLFLGNVHDATGLSAGRTPRYLEVRELHEAGGPGLVRALIDDVSRHPGTWVRLQVKKLVAFFGPTEIPNNVSFDMGRQLNPVLRFSPVAFHWLLPAAAIGLIAAWARRRELRSLYLFMGLFTLATVAFYVLGRLRQPIVPVLAIFAALAGQWCWEAMRQSRFRAAGAALAVAIAAPLLLRPASGWLRDSDYQMASAAHYSQAQIAAREGRLDEVQSELGRALVLNPDHAPAVELAKSLAASSHREETSSVAVALCSAAFEAWRGGDRSEAERLLAEAVAVAPKLALPWQYRANIHALEGEVVLALRASEKALQLEPANDLYRENLKRLRVRVRSPGGA